MSSSLASRSQPSGTQSLSSRRSVAPTPIPSKVQRSNNLPEYQKPVAPLDENSQRALNNLLRQETIKKLSEKLDKASKLLIDSSGEIGDKLGERKAWLDKRKDRHEKAVKENVPDGNEEEQIQLESESIQALENKVEGMTKRMEASLRKIIDGHQDLNDLQSVIGALTGVSATARTENTQYHTQLQSQRQSQRRRVVDADDDEEMSDGDVTQIPNTAEQNGTQQQPPQQPEIPSLTPQFLDSMQRLHDRYTAQTLTARYADHPDYTDFKRVVHDAKYAGAGPTIPHKRTWFAEEEGRDAPAPGVTGGADEAGNESDDSDIAIASVRISTRCPLTLLEFTDPVTSTICNHSYDRKAITDMIRAILPPTRARGMPPPEAPWVQSVQCPVAGCNYSVSLKVLETDTLLVRKIQRIQRAKKLAGVGGHDGVEVESVDSGSGDDVDDVDNVEIFDSGRKGGRIKREIGRSQLSGRAVEMEEIEDEEDD